MLKSELRKQAQIKRDSMDKLMVCKYGDIIANRVINHEWYNQAKAFIYVSMGMKFRRTI